MCQFRKLDDQVSNPEGAQQSGPVKPEPLYCGVATLFSAEPASGAASAPSCSVSTSFSIVRNEIAVVAFSVNSIEPTDFRCWLASSAKPAYLDG